MLKFKEHQDECKRRTLKNNSGSEFDSTFKISINNSIKTISRDALWRPLRRRKNFDTVTSYTTGTGAVTVTNGSKNFSVVGATFLTDDVRPGRKITFGTSSRFFIIDTITGETTGTINEVYDGTTSSTTSYEVLPQEIYELNLEVDHRCFLVHRDYGYDFTMEYLPEHEYRSIALSGNSTSTPTVYRMWESNQVENQIKTAGVVSIVSSSASDTAVDVVVFGTVGDVPDKETINSNGTSTVNGSKLFSNIDRIVRAGSSVGTITVTSDSGNTQLLKLPPGEAVNSLLYSRVSLYPLPQRVFEIDVYYYKRPLQLIDDNDIHELGEEFDEVIILLTVAKFLAQSREKEAKTFFSLYDREMTSLRKKYTDKIDWIVTMQKPVEAVSFHRRRHGVSFQQLGGHFGPSSRLR